MTDPLRNEFWVEAAADARIVARRLLVLYGELRTADSADITQSALLIIMQRAATDAGLQRRLEENPHLRKAYAATVTRHVWLNQMRASRRHIPSAANSALEDVRGDNDIDISKLSLEEIGKEILPDGDAALALRCILEIETLDDFAKRKSISVRSAQRTLVRGMTVLRATLERMWGKANE